MGVVVRLWGERLGGGWLIHYAITFIREWQRHVISTEAIQQHLANTRTTLFPQWITLGQPLGKFELLRIIVVKVTNRPTHLAGHIIRDGDVGE